MCISFQTLNSTYQNHVFRSMEQREGEMVAQFVTRLQQVVKDCDYGDQGDNQTQDQVVQRSTPHELRWKLLKKGDTLTLHVLLKTAASYEAMQAQLESMMGKTANVNQIWDSCESKHHRKGKKKSGENKTSVIDVATRDILVEILNVLQKERPAKHVVVLIILLRNAEPRQANQKPIRS